MVSLLVAVSSVYANPHLYNPYYNFFRYSEPYYNLIGNYANQIPNYTPYIPFYSNLFDQTLPHQFSNVLPTINILAEAPYSIANKFTVVPMLVVSQENMQMVSNAEIMSVSKTKPVMTIRNENNELKQCTPAVKIVLDVPIIVYSLKTSVVFPSEIKIVHNGYNIPIKIGAVIAPVKQDTFVSIDTPIKVSEVYGIPTGPVQLDYVNNKDAIFVPETEAVVVETSELEEQPPKNITIIEFPDRVAEPVIAVDEEDEELGNNKQY